ncbi:hypothetical protein H0H81_001786 [Sphagnurus paluster]|uniref:DUF1479-domain-containing protein n=1 Tax=Sphagnurus paluster TaxID=117069 RepID=A0A9P7FTZ6_9AGAR|nr:hypothetical protein H0H81_001786 [Sphagnurus paluster]
MPFTGIEVLPPRFANLKQEIAASYPKFRERATQAWREVIAELQEATLEIAKAGSESIAQVNFADLHKLGEEEIEKIKRQGSVVIKDIVPDAEAIRWKQLLDEFVKTNPDAEGTPVNDKQFFQLYWTKSQVEARAHPNVLAACVWLNHLYHTKDGGVTEAVDLTTPLTYADRFRIRHPGIGWNDFPPHIDGECRDQACNYATDRCIGGAIERWEDPIFRECFSSILSGDWRSHDPYELDGRLNASNSRYGRPNQSSVFRTFQGWLALSEIAPTQGTLRVFPNVYLSNAYIILRPFFRPTVAAGSAGFLNPENWELGTHHAVVPGLFLIDPSLDISSSEYPGIYARDGGYTGPRLTPEVHPHLELEKTMISIPKVHPGDAVFWHCDVIHSVESEHTGTDDSAVIYIPAVPLTPINQAYIERQRETFLKSQRPPDFPKGPGEEAFAGIAGPDDVVAPIGRRAMGLPISV